MVAQTHKNQTERLLLNIELRANTSVIIATPDLMVLRVFWPHEEAGESLWEQTQLAGFLKQ